MNTTQRKLTAAVMAAFLSVAVCVMAQPNGNGKGNGKGFGPTNNPARVTPKPTPPGHHYGWQKGKHNPHRL